jgi:hypothetical protein
MGGQLANYGRHFMELARGSRQPKDTKERRIIAIDRASRAHKTVPVRWRQQVKYPVRVLADVRRDTQRLHCAALVPTRFCRAPTNSSIGSSHCGATCTTTSNSCGALRHGQVAALNRRPFYR